MSDVGPACATIGGRVLSRRTPTYVVAEAGSNHDGDLATAHHLVDIAADAGADAVKFQSFRADRLYAKGTEVAEYLVQAGSAEAKTRVADLLRPYELPPKWLPELAAHAKERALALVSTPFDLEALAVLARLQPPYIKVASSEMLHVPLVRAAAATGLPVVLSTGMATMEEVAFAVDTAHAAGAKDLVLLQCVVSYPAPASASNLRVMATFEEAFGVPAGLSDHTPGITVPVAAAALGAAMIEKHFTIDRGRPGPDHKYALEPEELRQMVRGIRDAESALGDGRKKVHAAEAALRAYRAGIVSTRAIPAGTPLSPENVTVKRPGHGASPRDWDRVLGRAARIDIPPETVITWDMI